MWTRRALLKNGGLAAIAAGVSGTGPAFLDRAAAAVPEPRPFGRRKVQVTIFQRGAMDGLMAVSPLDEGRLRRLRPHLAMSAARKAGDEALLDLDGTFGLHPALGGLMPLWRDGRLAIVHAVGSPDPTRSHFDAQDYMESGTPGRKGTESGWLNRVSGLLGHEASPLRSVAITPTLPRSFYGAEGALAVRRLSDLRMRLPGAGGVAQRAGQGFEALYEQTTQDLLRDAGRETFEAVEMVRRVTASGRLPEPGVEYPDSRLGLGLSQIALLIKSQVGLEIAFAEAGGWDTHVQQGTTGGTFARQAGDLAASLAAFWADLGAWRDDVVVMTMTEFGRTVSENGTGGTDHGHGSCLFVLGNRVDGGKVHGRFPGLRPEDLFEGRDLPVTTDFRAVFSEVARGHLGIRDDGTLFPGWSGSPLPLIKRA